MQIRNGENIVKYIRTTGSGDTENDPYVMLNDTYIQDQHTDVVILPLAQQLGVGTITSIAVEDTYTVTVDNTANADVGTHIRIIDSTDDRYFFGEILTINGLTITVDTPFDFDYPSGSEVTYSNINLAVDGSVTPAHFHLRTGGPSIPSALDITRMIMVCECSSAVDLNKFGNITNGLDKGLVLRQMNGTINNIWNVKKNRDLISLGYDWTTFDASNPAQGIYGFSWRLTFAGQSKMGVTLRISQDGQLGIIVQDDLSSLTNLKCVVEGHVVE